MNYNDDTFKQAVELAKTHQAHPETILPICTTLGRVSRALLAAQQKIEELEAEILLNSKGAYILIEEISALEACLAEKDAALTFYSTYQPRQHPEGFYEIHIAPGEGGEVRFGTFARKVLALNPNQYQQRVKARDRVIEMARKVNNGLAEFDLIDVREDLQFMDNALAELEKLEGDGK